MKLEDAFGVVIKRRRKALGLSQEELGQRVDLYKTAVCRHETGEHVPSLSALIEYARVFECTLADLVNEAQTEADQTAA